jgi:hypothetical protein
MSELKSKTIAELRRMEIEFRFSKNDVEYNWWVAIKEELCRRGVKPDA